MPRVEITSPYFLAVAAIGDIIVTGYALCLGDALVERRD
jgi:hypothetical protein